MTTVITADQKMANLNETVTSSETDWYNWLTGTEWSLRDFVDGRTATKRDDTEKGGWHFDEVGKVHDVWNSWQGTWELLDYQPDFYRIKVNIFPDNIVDVFFITKNYFIGIDFNSRKLRYTGERRV
jgi:hypothetical protein